MAKTKQKKQPKATLRIRFERPGTEDAGELTFTGSPEFVSKGAHLLSYVTGGLVASYGIDADHAAQVGTELNQAWQAAKRGEGFEGEIVRVNITLED